MKPSEPFWRRPRALASLAACVFGALLTAGIGAVLLDASAGVGAAGLREKPRFGWFAGAVAEGAARLSYDLPFLIRGSRFRPDACIVYLDENAAQKLHQRIDSWDRRKHAELVRKLTRDGAKAIVFDIVFADPWPDSAVDEDFAAAIRENGHVFLGAALELDESAGTGADGVRVVQERVVPPTPVLRRAAAGWGLLAFNPVDADYSVRRLYAGTEAVASASWQAAQSLGAKLPNAPEERSRLRWMNYYGRADLFQSTDYDRALAEDGPREMFHGRIVIVGGRSTLGSLRLGKDEFRGPYGVFGGQVFKGPELHLTALLNLLHHEWLTRLAARRELAAVIAFGLILGAGLPRFRPHVSTVLTLVAMAAVAVLAIWLFIERRVWCAWCIPFLVQAPVALVWAVGTRYFIEERRRRALREAFAHYLSPHMADRIADADFDLSLGGTMVEATIMFTDLENFMGLSEELDDPAKVSRFLTDYFTLTTGHILESDGTILKYLGDSVQAVWGAPLPDPRQADKAVRAALQLHKSGQMEVLGRPLRTRIGLNTGRILAGNLGSAQRFDYATTGDAVNFASRLEGMNKFLGTHILISDSVVAQLSKSFVLRCVGEFRVVGKRTARVIYEVLGEEIAEPEWLAEFARALDAFRRGDFEAAERGFRQTREQRGTDGPSSFYLERLAAVRASGTPADWTGIIELSAK